MDEFWCEKRVLVTLGPTRAWLDPVRYLANTSSGRLGTAIAEELLSAGARLDVIAGEGAASPAPQDRLALHPISTVEDLLRAVHRLAGQPHPEVILHLMAVLDYRPAETASRKLPSGQERLALELVPTPKVVDEMRRLFPNALLVAFKLQSGVSLEDLFSESRRLLARSGADAVVANRLEESGPDNHRAWMLSAHKENEVSGPWTGKMEIARQLAATLPQLAKNKGVRHAR